jgi:phosphoribosylanthranilate isomerase
MTPIQRTRIKICGLTRPEDVACAVNLGVDALGFVFYPPSKRCLTPDQAAELVAKVPAFVSTVALFVEPEPSLVESVMRAMHPTYLQFHGDESVSDCERYAWPYIKAFRVGSPMLDTPQKLAQTCGLYANAKGWLFDSFTPAYGGSGHGFDRMLLSEVLSMPDAAPVILSGGLKTESIRELIVQTRPWAVDISSGVEQAPGVKSSQAMREFVAAVRQSDAL